MMESEAPLIRQECHRLDRSGHLSVSSHFSPRKLSYSHLVGAGRSPFPFSQYPKEMGGLLVHLPPSVNIFPFWSGRTGMFAHFATRTHQNIMFSQASLTHSWTFGDSYDGPQNALFKQIQPLLTLRSPKFQMKGPTFILPSRWSIIIHLIKTNIRQIQRHIRDPSLYKNRSFFLSIL